MKGKKGNRRKSQKFGKEMIIEKNLGKGETGKGRQSRMVRQWPQSHLVRNAREDQELGTCHEGHLAWALGRVSQSPQPRHR